MRRHGGSSPAARRSHSPPAARHDQSPPRLPVPELLTEAARAHEASTTGSRQPQVPPSAASSRRKNKIRSPSPNGISSPRTRASLQPLGWLRNSPRAIATAAATQLGRGQYMDSAPADCAPASMDSAVNSSRPSYQVVSLQLGHASPPPSSSEDKTVYLSILKELLCQEVRELIREELRMAVAVVRPSGGASSYASPVAGARRREKDTCMSDADMSQEHEDYHFAVERGMTRSVMQHDVLHPDMPDRRPSVGSADSYFDKFPKPIGNFCRSVSRCWGTWGTEEAPYHERSCSKMIIDSPIWNSTVTAIIVLNCMFMVYSLNYQLAEDRYLEVESASSFLFWCDVFFMTFYTCEFMLKISYYGWYYFYDKNWKLNTIDLLLLSGNIISVAQTILTSGSTKAQNFTWLRLLRLLRLTKVLRVMRLAVYFATLRAILTCLSSTLMTLFWSLTMLGLVYFMSALVLVSRILAHLSSKGDNLEDQEKNMLLGKFGSVKTTMESLVLATTGGRDWGEDFADLEVTGYSNQFIYMLFMLFIQIALMNIILGIFVDHAMKALEPDDIQKAHDNFLEEQHARKELRALCNEADVDQTGFLTRSEWDWCMQTGKMVEYLYMLGFAPHHLDQFFHILLSTSQGTPGEGVAIEDFVRGCMRLRGTASSFDMHAVRFEISAIKELLVKETEMRSPIHTRLRHDAL